MKKVPYFSIIMPVYNTEKYIRDSIDSVIGQDFDDWELIVVDDGSPDKAGKIADEYKSDKIKVIHKENGGTLMARQTAIGYARGKFILFIDSDDYFLNGALEHIHSILENNKCEMLIFDYIRVSSPTNRMEIIKDGSPRIIKGKNEILKTIVYDSSMNNLWRKAIKASCFDKWKDYSKFSHIFMGEDLLLTLDIIERVDSLILDKSKLYGYRINQDSAVAMDLEKPIMLDYSVREKAYHMFVKYTRPSVKDEKNYVKFCRKMFVISTVNKIAFQKSNLGIYKRIKSTSYYKKVLNRRGIFGAVGIRYTVLFEAFRRNYVFVINAYGAFLRWKKKAR
ncbi:glycosyltransferase family 2 protein [Candidatus Saccharibacteria bacterium]|nr:glycosyltransferase family 2 protein [Candidatus Saccharibacteria bacterium]